MDSGPRRADALGSCLSIREPQPGTRAGHCSDSALSATRTPAAADRAARWDHVAVDHADRASGVREDDAGTRMAARPRKHGLVPGHTGFRRRWGVLGRPRRSRSSGSAGRRRPNSPTTPGRRRDRASRPTACRAPSRRPRGVAGQRHRRPRRLPPPGRVKACGRVSRLAAHAGSHARSRDDTTSPRLGDSPSLPLRRGLRDRPRPASDD